MTSFCAGALVRREIAMGEVARIGIAHGRKVPSNRLLPRERGNSEPFVEKCLIELGCGDMVHPVLDGRPLSIDQIHFLLRDAPIAVVAKLVESVVGISDTIQLPRPMVLLPLQSWTRAST